MSDHRNHALLALERAGLTLAEWVRLGAVERARLPGIGRRLATALDDLHAEQRGTLVVTRHHALIEYMREIGIVGDDAQVLAHATPDDVSGRHVIGVLPLHLAAMALSVTEVPLALRADERGTELPIERLREIAGDPVTYTVAVRATRRPGR